ncbi:MAG: hypothetical protein U0930_10690 [Pirellulales bacterium]
MQNGADSINRSWLQRADFKPHGFIISCKHLVILDKRGQASSGRRNQLNQRELQCNGQNNTFNPHAYKHHRVWCRSSGCSHGAGDEKKKTACCALGCSAVASAIDEKREITVANGFAGCVFRDSFLKGLLPFLQINEYLGIFLSRQSRQSQES